MWRPDHGPAGADAVSLPPTRGGGRSRSGGADGSDDLSDADVRALALADGGSYAWGRQFRPLGGGGPPGKRISLKIRAISTGSAQEFIASAGSQNPGFQGRRQSYVSAAPSAIQIADPALRKTYHDNAVACRAAPSSPAARRRVLTSLRGTGDDQKIAARRRGREFAALPPLRASPPTRNGWRHRHGLIGKPGGNRTRRAGR